MKTSVSIKCRWLSPAYML